MSLAVPNVYTSIGVLGAFSALLALRMSMYRLAGSPGENKPNSPLNNFSEIQLLNAEWAPVGAFLALAAAHKGKAPAAYVDLATAIFVASRITFFGRLYAPNALKFLVGSSSMTVTYISTFALAYLAIA